MLTCRSLLRILGVMETDNVFTSYTEIPASQVSCGTVVTIGNFDGVHAGHRAILQNSISISRARNLKMLICTFEPHPTKLFARDAAPLRLTSPQKKHQLLADLQPDFILFQNFSMEFASMVPEKFVTEALANAMNAKVVVVGSNFKFGKNRGGDIQLLTTMGKALGFEVIAENLLHTTNEVISSSRIRALLSEGQVAQASALLERFHEISGTVVHGKRVGNTIGFPTINVLPEDVLVPGDGIYAAVVDVGDFSNIPAAVYIGDRPTLAHGHSIEAHLLDFHEDVYEEKAVIRFVDKVRNNQKFENLDMLQQQIARDVTTIRNILERHP